MMAVEYILKTYAILWFFGGISLFIGVAGFLSIGIQDMFAEPKKKQEDRLKKIEKELEELKKQVKATT